MRWVSERRVHWGERGEVTEVFTFHVDGRERPYRLELINGTPLLLGYGVNLAFADLSGAKLAGLDLGAQTSPGLVSDPPISRAATSPSPTSRSQRRDG